MDACKGMWYDHEAGEGGGVLDLIRRQLHIDKAGAIDWLQREGLRRCVRRPEADSEPDR